MTATALNISITLTPAELLELSNDPASTWTEGKHAKRCGCCGSRTAVRNFVLVDLRLWSACDACCNHNADVKKLLIGSTEVKP